MAGRGGGGCIPGTKKESASYLLWKRRLPLAQGSSAAVHTSWGAAATPSHTLMLLLPAGPGAVKSFVSDAESISFCRERDQIPDSPVLLFHVKDEGAEVWREEITCPLSRKRQNWGPSLRSLRPSCLSTGVSRASPVETPVETQELALHPVSG